MTYTAPVLNSTQAPQQVEVSVVGPGAKLKVFVTPELAQSTALQGFSSNAVQQDAVIGGMGGWRSASHASTFTPQNIQAEVIMLDYAQIEILLDELESTVAFDYVPLDYETRQVLDHTVAYYELPMGTGQDQLLPVYALNVEYTLASQEVITSPVYIPVNEQYMAPLAQINPVGQIPETIAWGSQLAFEATDASQTLASLGFDPSLTFALGTGNPDSYVYNWYLNSVEPANRISTGPTLNYTAALNSGFTPQQRLPYTNHHIRSHRYALAATSKCQ